MQAIWNVIESGGWSMYLIVVLSVLVVGVAAERVHALWSFIAKARTLSDTVTRCLFRGAVAEARAACERSRSPLADVFLVGFERLGRTSQEALEGAVDRERQRVTLDMRVRLWILGTVGALAPFIGLFGTVIGIMHAFRSISEQGQGGFGVVSRGISEALITTAAGIAVGVEAVAIYNYFNQRIHRIAQELKHFVDEFVEAIKSRGGERGERAQAAEAEAKRLA